MTAREKDIRVIQSYVSEDPKNPGSTQRIADEMERARSAGESTCVWHAAAIVCGGPCHCYDCTREDPMGIVWKAGRPCALCGGDVGTMVSPSDVFSRSTEPDAAHALCLSRKGKGLPTPCLGLSRERSLSAGGDE